MFCGPASIDARVIGAPGVVVGDLERAEALAAGVERAERRGRAALATGEVGGGAEVERGADVGSQSSHARLSFPHLPRAQERRAGVGTVTGPLAMRRARHETGERLGRIDQVRLPGLQRAVPSAPLDERSSVVSPSLTTDRSAGHRVPCPETVDHACLAGLRRGKVASMADDWRVPGCSSRPTADRCPSPSATTARWRPAAAAAGLVSGLIEHGRRRRRRLGLRGAVRRRPRGGPERARAAGWTATDTTPAAQRCGCSTSTRRRSTAPTTRSPTRRCGSCTTCSTPLPTAPVVRRELPPRVGVRTRPTTGAFAEALAEDARRGREGAGAGLPPHPGCRGCCASCGPTCASRTSRTRRGRRRTTSGCCPTTSRARRCSACSAPTTPASTPPRWAQAFADVLRRGARRDRGTSRRHDRRDVRRAHHPARRSTRSASTPTRLRERASQDDVDVPARRDCASTLGDRQAIVRVDRTELSQEHRPRPARLPRAAAALPRVARQGRAHRRRPTRAGTTCRSTASTPRRCSGWRPRSRTSSAPTTGGRSILRRHRRLRAVAGPLPGRRRAAVNPVRDGMNLVAKEVPVLSERRLRRRAVDRGRRGRRVRRRRAAGQPVRRVRHRRRAGPALSMPAASGARAPTGWPRSPARLPPSPVARRPGRRPRLRRTDGTCRRCRLRVRFADPGNKWYVGYGRGGVRDRRLRGPSHQLCP